MIHHEHMFPQSNHKSNLLKNISTIFNIRNKINEKETINCSTGNLDVFWL
jgi:hypothetical protein